LIAEPQKMDQRAFNRPSFKLNLIYYAKYNRPKSYTYKG
jgi:hypothetical protein